MGFHQVYQMKLIATSSLLVFRANKPSFKATLPTTYQGPSNSQTILKYSSKSALLFQWAAAHGVLPGCTVYRCNTHRPINPQSAAFRRSNSYSLDYKPQYRSNSLCPTQQSQTLVWRHSLQNRGQPLRSSLGSLFVFALLLSQAVRMARKVVSSINSHTNAYHWTWRRRCKLEMRL